MKEQKQNEVESFVDDIMRENNVRAKEKLEEILKKKVARRIKATIDA